MKNIFKIIAACLMLILFNSCTTQNVIPSPKVTSLMESGEFTFLAERANPTNYDVVKVMNSLPGSGSSQILNLDYGYILQIKKDEVVRWKCLECGYIHEGKEAIEKCPACLHPQSHFELFKETY